MDFSNLLMVWYLDNGRDLPWRTTTDPYKIWLSEIILQQTRVDQGLSYFNAFINAFPSVVDLAQSNESEVLKLWQGLGYYSRARNLHATAKFISKDLKGVFPNNYNDILSLKGVGPYTAAAISSFAFKLPYPVVDGNVYRVLSRVFQIDMPIQTNKSLKYFTTLAEELIDTNRPDIFNQAIMELGAMVCKPKNPQCDNCPVHSMCLSYKNKTQLNYPVKKQKINIKKRFFNYLVIKDDYTGKIYLEKRKDKDVWMHLYQFKLIESQDQLIVDPQIVIENFEPFKIHSKSLSLLSKTHKVHKLTHQHLYINFWLITGKFGSVCQYTQDDFNQLPFPKPIFEFLNEWAF